MAQGLIQYEQGKRNAIISPVFEDQKLSVFSLTNTFIDELGHKKDAHQYIHELISPYMQKDFGTKELEQYLIQITNETDAKRINKMTPIQMVLTTLKRQCCEIGLLEFYAKLDYVCRGEFGMLAVMKRE